MAMKKGRGSMPVISKIRFTNVIYENGNKRYQDEIFHFDGQNSTIVLENGGGKTVWVQAALQAILPHTEVAGRKVYETCLLSEGCAHIAIEWEIGQKPMRYLVTAVSLYEQSQRLQSYRYAYEYGLDDPNSLENIPFVEKLEDGSKRPVDRAEIQEYYTRMKANNMNAHTFRTIEHYHQHLSNHHIIAEEWKKIGQINGAEGGVGKFFEDCKTTAALVERLLIPVVEDAISGQGAKNFVESFEKQREHIKKYKQLKHQIDECESILEEVRGFTNSFEKWDKEQEAFNRLKSKAKAVFYLIEKEYEKENRKHESYLQDQSNIENDIKLLEHKEASYKLQILKKEVDEKHQQYLAALKEFETADLELNTTNHRLASLEYAQIKQSLEDSDKEEDLIKQAIKRLDQDYSAAELEEDLEENSQYLCGYYKNALEIIENDITKLANEQIRRADELESQDRERKKLTKMKQELEESKIKKQTEIDLVKEEINRLKQNILDNPQHETVEDKEAAFKKRLEAIDQEIRQIFDRRKQLENEQETLELGGSETSKKLDQLKDQYRENQNKLNNLEENHESLLQKIHTADYRWSHIESLYTNPLIVSNIETKIEKNRIKLSQARQEERISMRWLDDYQSGDYFLADATIMRQIEKWRQDIPLLLTGSEYIKGRESNFPYWAITLITTDRDKDRLRGYIQESKDYMNHPIWVMTEYEAGQYVKNAYNKEEHFIYPGLWEKNISQPEFKKWKKDLGEKAKSAQFTRKTIESTYQGWKTLKEEIQNFEESFPMELDRDLREVKFELKKTINDKDNRLKAINNREKEIIYEQKLLLEKESQLDRENNNISGTIQQAALYFQRKKTIQANDKELRELINPQLENINPRIKTLKKNVDRLRDALRDLTYLIQDKKNERQAIYGLPLYSEVKSYRPKYSSYSVQVLISERVELEKELGKQQRGRRELEEQLSKIRQDRIKSQRNLDNQILKYPSLDQTVRFIREHEREIQNLIERRGKLEQSIKTLETNKDSFKTQDDNHYGWYKGQKQELNKSYKEVFKWDEPLSTVKINLDQGRKDISGRLAHVTKQIKKTAIALEQTKEAKDYLDKKNERFQYLIDQIEIAQLQEDDKIDILYQRTKYIDQIITRLEKAEQTVESKKETLKTEEQKFTRFCRSSISNLKLQNLTLKGIENLTSYKEVVQWKNNLGNRIMHTKKIAQDDIKTHAEELDLFINFIHSYLKQVADALGEIHRKTRVKIDDQWKDVYTIKVPKWESLKGKEAIQNYVLWIIGQLESGKHPEETHRREIEKWLSVKQLLAVVTQNKPVTVRCRKLTNKNTLASVASSWESSNKWSGGERWSKNMILFLGLLNFLAEKTGHVIEGQKRNRTVILDNPFGQASSDHVLNPVFFVAEQLGFQIITLTALAEGSFIRKYFPVVYSCRLRAATDGTQVMGKEQQIQQALFKDDELPSIGRLEPQEQLSLLGD